MTVARAGAALRRRSRLDLVHPGLLLPRAGSPAARYFHRHAAAPWRQSGRRAGGAARLLRRASRRARLPDPAHARPRPSRCASGTCWSNTTPGDVGLNFKYWSPMSVGAWALLVASASSPLVSFVDALVRDGKLRIPLVAPAAPDGARRQAVERRRGGARPVRRRLHRRAARRLEPAGLERHLGAGRAVPRLGAVRLGRAAAPADALPPGRRAVTRLPGSGRAALRGARAAAAVPSSCSR